MKRQWGVRDRRTGQVWRSITFEVAQDFSNRESERLELVTRWPDGEWLGIEWFGGVLMGRRLTPPPPAQPRRVGVDEAVGRWGGLRWVRALYGAVRGLGSGERGLFRRNNG